MKNMKEKYINIIHVLIILIFQLFKLYAEGKLGGKWSLVGEIFGEQFETEFWKRPRKYKEFLIFLF